MHKESYNENNEKNYMIENLNLLRCYRSCLVANKLYEAKRTNIRNYPRRNYTAKLHQTTMNNTVKYMVRYATLRNDTKKAHTKFYYN